MVCQYFLSLIMSLPMFILYIYACIKEYAWEAMGQSGEEWGIVCNPAFNSLIFFYKLCNYA